MSPQTLYFAYGSNMCIPRLVHRVPSARFVEIARIEGYRLAFSKRSTTSVGSSGKATLVLSNQSNVYGGLFSFSNSEVKGLQEAEGYPKHYREALVSVITLSERRDAMTYIATEEFVDESQVPYDWYMDLVRFGGRRLGLPESYVAQLDAVKTKTDPDTERTRQQRMFLR